MVVSPFYLPPWLGIFELCAFVVVQLHHRYDFREEIKLVYYGLVHFATIFNLTKFSHCQILARFFAGPANSRPIYIKSKKGNVQGSAVRQCTTITNKKIFGKISYVLTKIWQQTKSSHFFLVTLLKKKVRLKMVAKWTSPTSISTTYIWHPFS